MFGNKYIYWRMPWVPLRTYYGIIQQNDQDTGESYYEGTNQLVNGTKSTLYKNYDYSKENPQEGQTN